MGKLDLTVDEARVEALEVLGRAYTLLQKAAALVGAHGVGGADKRGQVVPSEVLLAGLALALATVDTAGNLLAGGQVLAEDPVLRDALAVKNGGGLPN